MSGVKFISITPGAERQILYCARVSSNQENDDPGLLRYLIRNKHWSPFEMAHAVMEIETTRAIAPQILRHRSFSFQEFSQRYAAASDWEDTYPRRAGTTNRQGSTDDLHYVAWYWFVETQRRLAEEAFAAYAKALNKGIAPESARFLLPLSTTTKLYMSGSIRSWIHYFEIRCDEHTQLEHRLLAEEARALLAPLLPTIADALGW